ncbi:DUF4255 domain-containing protein [Teredinibacter franksiae]|uniref:DUF4255 domain-containing protein n=1 Tax=Teredinibacter franksiae TaxID=2761453 RepID=UPI0016243766|nr:DUF4255 domain-containing protein [Teredinibacter franksiae]
MIGDAIAYIRREVRDYLGVTDTEVSSGPLHDLSGRDLNPGVRIALVNVGAEPTLRNTSHVKRSLSGQNQYLEPPVFVNCHLMFAFDFSSYQSNLIRLSDTIEFFQQKPFFEPENARVENPFPAGLGRLVFDMCSMDFEQLNHLWGILGGAYIPSVLYKVRLIRLQAGTAIDGPEVTSIQVSTGFKAQ